MTRLFRRYALVNAAGKTVLEGPRFMIEDLAQNFEERYPGQYTMKEVVR